MALTNEQKRTILKTMIDQEETDLWGLGIELKKAEAAALAVGSLEEPLKTQLGRENDSIRNTLQARMAVHRAKIVVLQDELKALGA